MPTWTKRVQGINARRLIGESLSLNSGKSYPVKALKQAVRQKMLEKRRQLSTDIQENYARQISQQLFQQHYFHQAHHIALYLPFAGEVSTTHILEQAFFLDKSCYLPVLAEQQLQFVRIDKNSLLTKNRYGILEPSLDSDKMIDLKILDLVLMPLVAFDSQCHRLGMGGGYYDKTFHFRIGLLPRLVGLAYDFQCVTDLPYSNLDVSLDEIITEKKHYFR